MQRAIVSVSVLALLLLALLLTWTRAADPQTKAPPKPATPTKPQVEKRASMPAKLFRHVDFPGYADPKMTLDDALQDLTKKYGLPFLLNEKAFKFENIAEVGKTEIAVLNPIPAMKDVRVETIVRKILMPIPAPSGATFLVRRDAIEITTGIFLQGEVWFDDPAELHSGPVVQVVVEQQPFGELMKSLAEQGHSNILLDMRVGEKAQTPITAELYNVPLDTAVRLLASMADLRPVRVGNVLFVTSPQTAEAMDKAKPKKPQQQKANYSSIISGPSGTLIRVPNE